MTDIPPGFVQLKYSMDTIKRAYKAASDIHEQAGQRHATMLIFAAFIIESHSRMVPCDSEETLGLVRQYLKVLRGVKL